MRFPSASQRFGIGSQFIRSFAAAADELGRVPSALSYTMQKLEEELDVVLFDRSGHVLIQEI